MAIATAATAVTELEWLLSSSLEGLFKESIPILGSDYGKDLEDLDTSLLPQIQRTIQAPQYSPHKAQLARWFMRLSEACYEAKCALHEVVYDCLIRKVERKIVIRKVERKIVGGDRKLWVRVSSKPIIKPLAKFAHPAVKRSSLLSPLKKKLLDRLKKVKEIAAEAKTFHDLLGIQNTGSNDAILTGNSSSVTSSFLIDRVFGRDGDRDEIINFLLDKQGGSSLKVSYSVVAVTAIGGVGKTTLVQYVYNDERVKNHFGVRMWLCPSPKFDTINLTKEMIECASEKECPNLSSLDVLQDKLIETLPKSEKIMVVLDDFWYDNNDKEVGENKWNNLLKPLIKFASRGGTCKIVVTSRSASFPFALLPGKLIELSNLAPNDSISLLRYHAIAGLQINDPQLKNDLSDIVDQLRLSVPLAPLAAKLVGNQLRQRPDIKFWQATLGNVNLSTDDELANNSHSITPSLLSDKVFGRDELVNFLLDDEDRDGGSNIVDQNVKKMIESPMEAKVVGNHLRSYLSDLQQPFQTIQARYRLNFINKAKNPTFTADLVRDENGDPIKVAIYDMVSQSIISPDCFLSSAIVRLTVLNAELWEEKGENWSWSEINQSVLRAREGKGPILKGRSRIRLENGLGAFQDIVFNDNSSWTKSGYRLGVMVEGEGEEGYLNGERIQEGVSERFLVKDSRGKASQKPDLLELKHGVQCLKNVGTFHASLLQKKYIKTVDEFLKLYYNDEPALRKILGIKSESDEGWKSMVEHAMQCKYNDLSNSSQCVLPAFNIAEFHLLCLKDSGVLYEDPYVQIGVKAEWWAHHGRLILFFDNKKTLPLESVRAIILPPDHLKMKPSYVPDTIPPRAQVQCLIEVINLRASRDAAVLDFSYNFGTIAVNAKLPLPAVLNKFMQPITMTPGEFSQQWNAVAGPLKLQEVVRGVKPMTLPEMRNLFMSLHLAVTPGLDTNPNNLVACGIFYSESTRALLCFVQVETDPLDRTQLGMTLASEDPALTFELIEFIKVLLRLPIDTDEIPISSWHPDDDYQMVVWRGRN